ncbi:alpha-glucuronidase family glycosyl hydrolase [Propioniciclava coleopterorum]|uniref:alpha-glucuronidase family glycosyl hydrolase n=1 Tax=Propioniciclava coleopterorum TaxID=2714937 RepID=UPI00197D4B5C|nr:alpha-glucuronidase family glycosyl hydrolase [Propioniciclava coleopterorum]
MDVSRRTVLIGAGALAALATVEGIPAFAAPPPLLPDEDGSLLWLRYAQVQQPGRLKEYREILRHLVVQGTEPPLQRAAEELRAALPSLVGQPLGDGPVDAAGVVLVGTTASPDVARALGAHASRLTDEGYAIVSEGQGAHTRRITVAGRTAAGALRGAFALLRLIQTEQRLMKLAIVSNPAVELRMANHWDNLDGSVERGYAGASIFGFANLPTLTARHRNYARMLASTGMNATVINNVNASPTFLTTDFLTRVVPLAELLRGYGVRLWLSANFASPMVLTKGTANPIPTADPADPRVQQWWRDKASEVYRLIPDFGGFLVKADSEGQPGPEAYGRTQAEGANVIAHALAPHGGRVVWRSFTHSSFSDWAEYQYRIFAPLNGQFADNAVLQTKYGPIDFQIREPVHPLFGALDRTHQMLELQLTQEYTGHNVHAVFLAPMWRTVLDFPTRGPGAPPTVADIVAGRALPGPAGIAGVMNIGDDADWTGYQFGAANTFAYGRLCWQPDADPAALAREWAQMTFRPARGEFVDAVVDILMRSYGAYEDVTSPLGIGYFTDPAGSHFDPAPATTNTQSHFSTATRTGFDRTVATGTGFTGLYPPPWKDVYEDLSTCPDALLLFMHQVPYTHRLHSGETVIEHIYDTHFDGLEAARSFAATWAGLAHGVDAARHADIGASFDAQVDHARLWRDTVVAFYFSLSRILSEDRSWFQVGAGTDLLLGGWPNRFEVTITNATAQDHEAAVGLSAPAGWQVGTTTVGVASTEDAVARIPVTPPLTAAVAEVSVTVGGIADAPVLGAAQRVYVAPAGQRCFLALDGGTASSPLLPGYTRLSEASVWSEEAGFGWVGSRPSSRDRTGNLLVRDFVGHPEPRTLRFKAPAGRHTVHLLVGDMGPDAEATHFSIDGAEVAATPWQRGGSARWTSFDLDGGATGRTVDMRMTSEGGWWRLNALAIPNPDAPLPDLVVAGASTAPVWWAGTPTPVLVDLTNPGTQDRTVTVSAAVPQGWTSAPVTVTVPAGSGVTAELPVTPPAAPTLGRLTLTVARADGSVVETGRALSVVTTIAPDAAALALDAGTDASALLDGYTRLGPGDAWDPAKGFGWVGAVPQSRDRGGNVLTGDFVLGRQQPYVLRVAVPPGVHRTWVLTGDGGAPAGITTISEGGRELARSGSGELPGGNFVWFGFDLDGGAAGRTADLTLTGSLRDGYWRVNALTLSR